MALVEAVAGRRLRARGLRIMEAEDRAGADAGRAWRLRRLRTRTVLGHRVAVADGHLSRLLGLALLRRRRAGPGLLLPGCRAIHTVGMLFRLDVTFLDADCRELRCEQEVGFGRWLNEPNAAAVLELPSGAGAREPSLPRSRRRRSATVRGRP